MSLRSKLLSRHEVIEASSQRLMAVVMEAFEGCFPYRPDHPFQLTIGPGTARLCQTVFNLVGFADHLEAYGTRQGHISITALLGELDAVIGQNGMDPIRDHAQEIFKEFPSRLPVGFFEASSVAERGVDRGFLGPVL